VGQFVREAIAFKEFSGRVELEREHERNEQLRRQLERLSREDPLTGLANRRCWDETLAREFERSRRQDGSLAIILCDLDRLKDVNDRFGHATGDRVLKATADVLAERVRASDLAARLGGDEFAVLCPDTEPEEASRLAEELRARLAELSSSGEALPEVTVSIGVTGRSPQDLTATDVMLRADDRLYRAKGTRNAVWLDAPVGAV
jgi:diguanylate cyclase (GGDEF)-like protein